jgi:hypothetical protein
MTDNPLKSVFVLDPETQGYTPVAHNLSAAEAVERVQQFSNETRTATVLDQEQRHRSADPAKCKFCKQAEERLTLEQASSAEPERDAATS